MEVSVPDVAVPTGGRNAFEDKPLGSRLYLFLNEVQETPELRPPFVRPFPYEKSFDPQGTHQK